jgi:putative heme-binding domain-containing protein
VPYTVLTRDGRVLAGIVRAEGADAIKVTNTEGKSEIVAKAAIEELKPSATSIMPVGLLGAVGEEGVRDLLAFLTAPPPDKK